jgi:hypothetical protein
MAKTKRRARNIARKPKSRPAGFVPQTGEQRSGLAPNLPPDAGNRTPDPGPASVPPEAASGFVSQNGAQRSDRAPNSSQDPGPRTPDPGSIPPSRSATNRANAQHSTGPRTDEGKARSSQNARKHGLSLQRHAVLEHEDPAAYDRLHEELAAIYEPASPREHLALEEIAHCRWALQRFDVAEAALLENHFALNADPAIEHDCHIPYGTALGYACILEHGEPAPLELPSILLLHRYRTHWEIRYQVFLCLNPPGDPLTLARQEIRYQVFLCLNPPGDPLTLEIRYQVFLCLNPPGDPLTLARQQIGVLFPATL